MLSPILEKSENGLANTMLSILLETSDFLVVDKPAGILVHRHHRFPNERPMLQRVRDQIGCHVWPIHRLDRQTSGCLLMAKSKEHVPALSEALTLGQKYYWAVVRGYFTSLDPIVIETPIQISKDMFKDAKSIIHCIGRTKDPRCSLLRVQPMTGRNHQVRRHVRDLNHPILHDGDHGDSRINRWWRENKGLRRLALHAYKIQLTYNEVTHNVNSPFPDDLSQVFRHMPWWESAQEVTVELTT